MLTSESLIDRPSETEAAAPGVGLLERVVVPVNLHLAWPVRLAIGVVLPLIAFFTQPLLQIEGQTLAWFLFVPAVFFAGWAGGFLGGAAATLASVVLVHGFILPPHRPGTFRLDAEFVQLVVVITVGLLASVIHGQLRRAVVRLEAARVEGLARSRRLAELSTQLEHARARLQLAADSAQLGVWSWDFRTDRVEWDARTCAMLEAPPQIVAAGRHKEYWQERVHPEDVEKIEALRATAAERTQPVRSLVKFRRADGTRFLQTTSLVVREGGREVGMIGTNLDVTSEILAQQALAAREQEIAALNRQLEERVFERTSALVDALHRADAADQARVAFLENVSHELRTPLNPIIGLSSVLSDQVDDPAQQTQLQSISAGGRRLLSLVTDLLELTRKASEDVVVAPVDIGAILAATALAFESRAREKGLRVIVQNGNVLPVGLHGDSVRLTQVLMQLLSNAVKFSDRGTITVRATILEQSTALATVKFEVQDEGEGIPTELQSQVFEAFAQAEHGMRRKHGGLGIGLAVVRKSVERLGGRIGVRSQPGEGSTFWFTVPFLVVDETRRRRADGGPR